MSLPRERMTVHGDSPWREQLLREHNLQGAVSDSHLDSLALQLARQLGVASARVTIVRADVQRFIGTSELASRETPLSTSFCATAMHDPDILVVPDASRDRRFADFALVTGPPFIRFYAGVPLVTPDGVPVGALCVFDPQRRAGLTRDEADLMRVFAQAAMDRLRLRRAEQPPPLDIAEAQFRDLTNAMPQMVWSASESGYCDYFNARWYAFTGLTQDRSHGELWLQAVHPDDREDALDAWRRSIAARQIFDREFRLRRADGTYLWALARAVPVRDSQGEISRWFGTCTDIDGQRQLLAEREVISQELSHRIKNIFAVISGLIGLAARDRPAFADTAQMLRDRVLALGRAHDFVRPQALPGDAHFRLTGLHGLLTQLVAPYESRPGERVKIAGVDPAIDDRSATPLALLVHELATNAAKYGALSVAGGRVDIAISENEEQQVCIRWVEHGGPRVVDVNPPGFGSRLLDLSLRKQLGGDFIQRWEDGKLDMTILIPRSSFSRTSAPATA